MQGRVVLCKHNTGKRGRYLQGVAARVEKTFQARTQLAPVFAEKTADLRNVYAVSRPNPARFPAGRVDADGTVLSSDDRTFLCRCGSSGNKPFCDGSHKQVSFEG